jgi:hypothetical protein
MKPQKQKRRPSLEDLQNTPELIPLELAYVMVAAEESGNLQLAELAEEVFMLENATPERVVQLRDLLQPVAKEVQV